MLDTVTLDNIEQIYREEITKTVKNKKQLYKFDLCKYEYLINIKMVLLNGNYNGGTYNLFVITKPKIRLIMSQKIYDKVINHFVTRYILEPKLTKFLDIRNAATRKNMGTSYAIEMFKKYIDKNKKNENMYVLKMDINKYFNSIDHNVLKKLVKPYLNQDEYNLISKIIDSTNDGHINNYIDDVNTKYGYDLPRYQKEKGLPIGNMTSQFLAIFYLSKLHHYIVHDLKLKYMICYMDDYIIIHQDKKYLEKCLIIIKRILKEEYKLELNKNKTVIRNLKQGIEFLGYVFKIKNEKTIVKLSQKNKIKINKKIKSCRKNHEEFSMIFSKLMNYKYSYIYLQNDYIEKTILKFW